jgi:ADP-ribose pyrophosphatase YjhB (NUDIX family)
VSETIDALPLLEQLQSIARNGLHYTKDPYDRQRYGQLFEIVTAYTGKALELPPAEVRAKLAADPIPLTPKLGADAAIFDDDGRVLLMLRADNQRWCLPCGFTEPGESPEQTVVREVKEETGLDARVLELVGVFTRLPSPQYTMYTVVAVAFLCEVTGGVLRGSHEDLGLRYWALDEVPLWHGHHERMAREAHAKWLARRP